MVAVPFLAWTLVGDFLSEGILSSRASFGIALVLLFAGWAIGWQIIKRTDKRWPVDEPD